MKKLIFIAAIPLLTLQFSIAGANYNYRKGTAKNYNRSPKTIMITWEGSPVQDAYIIETKSTGTKIKIIMTGKGRSIGNIIKGPPIKNGPIEYRIVELDKSGQKMFKARIKARKSRARSREKDIVKSLRGRLNWKQFQAKYGSSIYQCRSNKDCTLVSTVIGCGNDGEMLVNLKYEKLWKKEGPQDDYWSLDQGPCSEDVPPSRIPFCKNKECHVKTEF